LLPIGAPFWVIPAALGVLGVYAITLLVTGELERSDLEFVLSLATKKK
jgi:hypothetical protein